MIIMGCNYLHHQQQHFFASYTTRRLSRRFTMLIAGFFFTIGVVFNAAAQDLGMLIIGRIMLGCGVGFTNKVSKFRLINSEEWWPSSLARHPGKFECEHSLYTLGPDIRNAILHPIDLPLRRGNRTSGGVTKRTIALPPQNNCIPT